MLLIDEDLRIQRYYDDLSGLLMVLQNVNVSLTLLFRRVRNQKPIMLTLCLQRNVSQAQKRWNSRRSSISDILHNLACTPFSYLVFGNTFKMRGSRVDAHISCITPSLSRSLPRRTFFNLYIFIQLQIMHWWEIQLPFGGLLLILKVSSNNS